MCVLNNRNRYSLALGFLFLPDTLLHNRNNMLYTVLSVFFQPFIDNCHKTADMELHNILPIPFRHLKPV